jgi:organic radical activating enzyme
MYRINEIFYSLQGEGFHTGTPAVFVRFSGCNLHCAFCDTQHQTGERMTTQAIVDEINRYPNAPLIVLTGGEPSLFIDEAFVEELKQKTGKRIAIETNGTRPLPDNIDWVTLSPKTGFDGGDSEPCVLKQCDELKVVYLGQDLTHYDHIEAKHRFLQPCFSEDDAQCQINMKSCVDAVMNNPSWRLSLQTHRILGIL